MVILSHNSYIQIDSRINSVSQNLVEEKNNFTPSLNKSINESMHLILFPCTPFEDVLLKQKDIKIVYVPLYYYYYYYYSSLCQIKSK